MRSSHETMREQEEQLKVTILNNMTGRGAFQCKKALVHNGWDLEQSVRWLKEHNDNDIYRCKRKIENSTSESYNAICQLSFESGYSFNDCKAALSEVNCDMSKARSELYGSHEAEEAEEEVVSLLDGLEEEEGETKDRLKGSENDRQFLIKQLSSFFDELQKSVGIRERIDDSFHENPNSMICCTVSIMVLDSWIRHSMH